MELKIFLPPELLNDAPDIQRFFDAMVYKLRKNARKGSFRQADVAYCLRRIQEETGELEVAISEGNMFEVALEAADVSNLAMIAATAAMVRGGGGDPTYDEKAT